MRFEFFVFKGVVEERVISNLELIKLREMRGWMLLDFDFFFFSLGKSKNKE